MFDIVTNYFRNEMNYLTGTNQEFDKLLESGDIGRVRGKMQTLFTKSLELSKQYNPSGHKVMRREDKIITNKLGIPVRTEKTAKLPVPYQKYINEIALTFLLGKPLLWSNKSEDCDDAFDRFRWVLDRTHLNSKLREAKRIAGSETESAILFRVFKGDDGNPDVQCKVLAASKGDEIYTRWDVYGNLITFAWGYYGKDIDDNSTECFDVYTPQYIYRCVKAKIGWQIEKEDNLVGKIPVIIFRQEEEWAGVQELIERNEFKHSKTADSNDYFEDPMLMLKADVIKSMPEKRESGRTVAVKGDINLSEAGKFLTYDQASESKKQEVEWLDETILKMSFTPDITIDTMKGVAQMSAKALRTVLLLGYIKADRRKDTWDEMMDRMATLIASIVGNVIDVSLKGQCDKMQVEHHWQEPFGDDITDTIKNISDAFEAGFMSEETAIEQNPLVKDKELEKERLEKEKETSSQMQNNIFNQSIEEPGTAE